MNTQFLTGEGQQQLLSQLEYLRTVKRAEVARYLREAIEAGDVRRISHVSPVGKALLGHQVGDQIMVSTPGGVKEYTILGIA